jgi:hypothetical protein
MTAQQYIETALRKLVVLPSGGTISANQLAAGLSDLNDMAVTWRQFGLTTWARASQTFSLVNGTGSYTVGSGGDVAIARPIRILDAYLTRDGTDIPLRQVSKSDYFGLSVKTTGGIPSQFYYNQETTLATLYLWPVPDEDGLTLTFDYHVPLTSMAAGDTLDVPDEWREAFVYNLAVRQAPDYGKAASAELRALAKDTLDLAKGSNNEETSIRFEPVVDE